MKPLLFLLLALGLAAAPTAGWAGEDARDTPLAAPAATATDPAAAPGPAESASAQAAPTEVAPATAPAAPVITAPPVPAAAPVIPVVPAPPPAPAKSVAPVRRAAASQGPSELVRRRCKIAGAVLLGVAGATVVAFFGTLIYNAVASPDQQSIAAGPRLGFGLSALVLGISGSALLGYSLNAPSSPALTPSTQGSGRVTALELRF